MHKKINTCDITFLHEKNVMCYPDFSA